MYKTEQEDPYLPEIPIEPPEQPKPPEGMVIFDPTEFKEIYPQFQNISNKACEFAFNEATFYLENNKNSIVKSVEKRKLLLYLLTCHVLTLKTRGDIVGKIASATEGSVSVSYANTSPSANAEWYSQTQCGLSFYQAIKPYLLGRYYGKC